MVPSTLRPDPQSPPFKVIEDFIKFLEEWGKYPMQERLSTQTHKSMLITLKGILKLVLFLGQQRFLYLMLKNLNQDLLENFNGMVRNHCGSNTHPDPKQFIEIFRLLSVASLIKPPRASNVTGGENMKTLLSLEDIWSNKNKERKLDWERTLDEVLDSEEHNEKLEANLEHTYHLNQTVNDASLNMFGGYVTRKARRSATASSCQSCFDSLTQVPESPPESDHIIIRALSKGYHLIPSRKLYNLLYKMETTILDVRHNNHLEENIIFKIGEKMSQTSLPRVGCEEHNVDLTKEIVAFYINTRCIFGCKHFMETQNIKLARKKALDKVKKAHHT